MAKHRWSIEFETDDADWEKDSLWDHLHDYDHDIKECPYVSNVSEQLEYLDE